MLHAGVLKKFGLYGLLRVAVPLLPEGAHHWQTLLVILLLGNIIYVGLVTIAQERLDWMLGYSSVMHMGYIFLGIASSNPLGLNGAAVLMFAHGISIALLFALAGEIRRRAGTLVFDDLGGLGKLMPFAGLGFRHRRLRRYRATRIRELCRGSAGLFRRLCRRRETGMDLHLFQVATILALWGVVISTVYMLRAYGAIFMGPPNERFKVSGDLARNLRLPVILLITATLVVGFFPNTVLRLLRPTFPAAIASNQP